MANVKNETLPRPEQNFLEELYGEKKGEIKEEGDEFILSDEEVEEDEDPASPIAPKYSPHPSTCGDRDLSPYRARSSKWDRSRTRSRSPIGDTLHDQSDPIQSSPRVVLRMYDETGEKLAFQPGDDAMDAEVIYEDEFMVPDAHFLYVNEQMERESVPVIQNTDESSEKDRSERDMRARGVRVRGGRRGRGRRGQGVGGGRRRREAADTWEVGHPLEEIWVTDNDVPLELREMAMDVVKRRQKTSEKGKSNRNRRDRNRMEEDDESESTNDYFEDALDESSNSLMGDFEWSTMETFQCREEVFKPERTGAVVSYSKPYDAFRSYWDDSILKMIAKETNRYAMKIPSLSFQAEWYPTNSHEILCLFAFWMMLGIIRMPTIESCFSTHYLLKTEIFRHILTSKRYRNLVRALHFVDSSPNDDAASTSNNSTKANSDPICSLRPILDHINAKFQANYVPSQNICIDESLTLWKGRLNIKQYLRFKAAKFCIKTFELCESATGYLWSLIVYTGKQNDFIQPDSTVSKSTAIVKKLIAPLLNKGYRLFMDNWYNSPLLARFLKRNGTECIGTLRSCRQDVPLIIKKAPLRQGQFIARHAGDLCVLSWQDKKRVDMISTCHGSAVGLATIPSRPSARPLAFKPQMVLDYNKWMGGVDLKDQMLEPYLLERKRCAKWYMKFFKRLLNVSILNARILLQSSQQQSVDHLDFRLRLVDAIVEKHIPHCPKPRNSRSFHTPVTAPHHLNHTHWPVSIPPSASRMAANRKGVLACFVCKSETGIKKTTSYKCETCDVPLCVENCFRVYHTS